MYPQGHWLGIPPAGSVHRGESGINTIALFGRKSGFLEDTKMVTFSIKNWIIALENILGTVQVLTFEYAPIPSTDT